MSSCSFHPQAEACRSVEQAMRKCPNGFYAEIKYDGERVQLHKKGGDFQYFSRSLKPVLPHKVIDYKIIHCLIPHFSLILTEDESTFIKLYINLIGVLALYSRIFHSNIRILRGDRAEPAGTLSHTCV